MSKDIYCESHHRFEKATWGTGLDSVDVLNEDVDSRHHFKDAKKDYIHWGRSRASCRLCHGLENFPNEIVKETKQE